MSRPIPLDPFRASLTGPRLVDASAGTGKTHAIVSILLRLLLQGPGDDPAGALRIDQVLVVTFTRAATAELRERIRRRLEQARRLLVTLDAAGPADTLPTGLEAAEKELAAWLREAPPAVRDQAAGRLGAALADLDSAAIHTIHGLCQRLLQDYAFESGMDFGLDLATDASLLQRELVLDFWAQEAYGLDPELLQGLMDKGGFKPAALEALAKAVIAQPWAHLVPPLDGDPAELAVSVERALADLRRVADDLRAAWAAGGPAALEALAQAAEAGRVNRGIFKPDDIRKVWTRLSQEALAAERGGGAEALAASTWFKWLSPARMATKTNGGRTPPEHPFFDACGAWTEARAALEEPLARLGLALRHRLAERLRTELPRRRRLARQLSFDDLIHRLDEALARPDGAGERLAARIRGRFRAALIDEFQDTDPVQDRIFSRLFQAPEAPELPFLRIGDPKQAIYRFRGADVFAYLEALRRLPDGARFHLDTNHRSDPALVRVLNSLWTRVPRPFLFSAIDFAPVQAARGADRPWPALRIAYLGADRLLRRGARGGKAADPTKPMSQRAATQAAVTAIGRLLQEAPLLVGEAGGAARPVDAADIAVLVRDNREARRLQRALAEAGIPAALLSDASVLDQPEAADVERLLAALLQPGDAGLVRAALIAPPFGLDAPGLEALQNDTAAWEARLDSLREAQETWRRQGLLPAYRRLLGQAGGRALLLARRGGERSLANLDHLVELLHSIAHNLRLGPEAMTAWLARARVDQAYRDQSWRDLGLLRLERDSQAVMIMTMHRSKGLEFPFVFCPFLWSGLKGADAKTVAVPYHELAGERAACLDIGIPTQEAARAAHDLEAMADDLRLLYVTLTRAKHQVWLAWGPLAGSEASALAYLLNAPEAAETQPSDDDPQILGPWLKAVADLAKQRRQASLQAAEAGGEDPLWAQLQDLAKDLGDGVILERPGRRERGEVWVPGPLARPLGPARVAIRPPRRSLRRSSYSALLRAAAARAEGAGAPEPEEVRDLDAATADAGALEAPALASEAAAPENTRVPLADLPAGTRLGTGLHALMERIDFQGQPESWDKVAEDLRRRGILPVEDPAMLLSALPGILDTPLLAGGGPGICLRALDRRDRRDELSFVLPVALRGQRGPARVRAAGQGFRPSALARLLDLHGGEDLPPGYPDRLRELDAGGLAGWLSGAIDLVFRHPGADPGSRTDPGTGRNEGAPRWYLLDWKSNRLGQHWEDYAAPRLAEEMARHHYILQAQLYTLALHRHLRQRLGAAYDYDRHFGGAFYVFVRGVQPDVAGSGTWFGRPPRARIEAMDRLFAEGAP